MCKPDEAGWEDYFESRRGACTNAATAWFRSTTSTAMAKRLACGYRLGGGRSSWADCQPQKVSSRNAGVGVDTRVRFVSESQSTNS